MKTTGNIITIHEHDIHEADKAFAAFMQLTEDCFNDRSKNNPQLYASCSPNELEEISVQLMREVAVTTPFLPSDITLVSGHSFPDIMATSFYGVEVKSTQKNKWTSTGSSIVESTRNGDVEKIYMLFGNLGGTPPAFLCRPYQDCLSNIAVTHSPRYLIDMELRRKGEPTIFDKLGVEYNSFCSDEKKIDVVRNYYIQEAIKSNRHELPWWVGSKTVETTEADNAPNIRLMNNCSAEEIKRLKAYMFILFPEVINGFYDNAALWLCTQHYLLCLNLRDQFSAGGQWKYLNNRRLPVPYPAVLGKLMSVVPIIRDILTNEEEGSYVSFNPSLMGKADKMGIWIEQVRREFDNYQINLGGRMVAFKELEVDLEDMIKHPERYILAH